jgi:phenylpropionate dioxygenase-like ring-hydroxylating dioxygenase large terminal subunit
MRYEPTPADLSPGLTLAATYTREVRAGIDRIWENVLDWEHLPALHEIYFSRVALVDSGSWAGGSS